MLPLPILLATIVPAQAQSAHTLSKQFKVSQIARKVIPSLVVIPVKIPTELSNDGAAMGRR